MKKILSLILALTLCFTAFALVSCGNEDGTGTPPPASNPTPKPEPAISANPGDVATLAGKTPEELYNAIITSLENVTNMTATSEQLIYMDMDLTETAGQPLVLQLKMNQTVKQKFASETNQSFESFNATEVYDPENNVWRDAREMFGYTATNVYLVDGYAYSYSYVYNPAAPQPEQTSKKKIEITEDTLSKLLPEGTEEAGALTVLPSSFFTGAGFVANEDGSYSVIVTMNAEKYSEYFGELSIALDAVDVKKVVHSINFDKDGNLINVKSDVSLSVEMQGVMADATVASTTVFTDIGTTAPITAPEDAESYKPSYI